MGRAWPAVVARARALGGWALRQRYLLAMVAAYTVTVGSLSTYRYDTGQTYAWDLGIMQQALYSAAFHGRFFYYTPELFNKNPSGSYFGVHFSLLMFPLAGFYRIFPSAPALLYLQAFVVAIAAVPLVALCRALGCPRATVFAALYLLSPFTILSNLYDFHLEAFVPLGVFLLLLALVRQRPWATVASAVFVLSIYEYGAVFVVGCLVVAAMLRYRELLGLLRRSGLAELLRRRWVLLGLALAVLSGATYVLAFAVIYAVNPALRGLNGSFVPSAINLAHLSPTGPWTLLLYFGLPFVLLAFLPLVDPRPLLLVLPFVVPALLSSVSYYAIGYQYGFLVIPGYVLAAALGLRRRAAARPSAPPLRRGTGPALAGLSAATVVVIVVVASSTSYGSWFGSGALMGGESPWNAAEYRLVHLTPAGASVLVDDNAFPWVANDLRAYVIPLDIEPSPVSFYDAINSTLHVDPQYIVLDTIGFGLFPYFDNLSGFVDANYAPAAEDYGVVLLEWHYAGPETYYQGYHLAFGPGAFVPNASAHAPYYWNGPYAVTIPGNYTWTVGYTSNASGNLSVTVTAQAGAVVLESSVVQVNATPPGSAASFALRFRSTAPEDSVELLVSTSPAIDLATTGATLTERGP
jgi:uncharacterized membrane protein